MAAASITLINGDSYIEIQFAAGHKITIPKAGLGTKIKDDKVILFWAGDMGNKVVRPYKELKWQEITSPTVGSAAILRTLILNWISTEAPEEAGGSATYVGLPSNGDFITAYTAATQITFSGLPSGIVNIVDENIETVRQINTGGKVVAVYERGDAAMTVAANVLTITGAAFANTDTFVVFTNIPRASSGGGASADADFKIASWDGTVTYASTTTLTLAGAYPTINQNSQVVFIKFVDDTLGTSEVFVNGQGGIVITHSGGTLTIAGAGTPFAATNDYEVGINATPISLDIDSDTTKTTEQAPDYGHYTDVEHIVEESDLGIDGTHDGGASATVFTDTGETYTAESVAEGYLIYNVSDTESAIITAGAGAGTPTADDITHAALGGAAQWAGAETASIPECKRFEIDAKSFNSGSIQAKITAGAANKVFLTVWASNNADADTTDDTDWIDVSTPCLGAVDINATASSTTEGIYPLRINANVEKYPVLKWMIKIVAECSDGVQSNSFDVYLIKST